MPEFQTFLDGQNMGQFWDNVKWFLFLIAPIVMIFFATDALGWLIKSIRGAFAESTEKEKKKEDDDDVYYY